MKKVAVVILTYNGKNLLQKFLPTVIASSSEAHIVVADNGSSDNSVTYLQENFPTVQVISHHRNYGFCEGYNKALKQVDAPYYILLNSDVEVTLGWINPLLSRLENNVEVAAVQPKILSYHVKNTFEYAGAAGGFMDCYGYPFCRGRIFTHVEKDEGQYDDTSQIFWASGACIAIRSDVFHQLGGFNKRFFAHMEEIDLCWKINRMGLKVGFEYESIVYHVGGGTLAKTDPRKTYLNFRNSLSLLFLHTPNVALLRVFIVRYLLDFLTVFFFLMKGQFYNAFMVIKAILNFLVSLPKEWHERKAVKKKMNFYTGKLVYKKSIVWQFFVKKKKKYSEVF